MNTNSPKFYEAANTDELKAKRADIVVGLKNKFIFNNNIHFSIREGDILTFPDNIEDLLIDDRIYAGNQYYTIGCIRNAAELCWVPIRAFVRYDAYNNPIGEVARHLLEDKKVTTGWEVIETIIKEGRAIVAGKPERRYFPVFDNGQIKHGETQVRLFIPLNYCKE